MSAARLPATIEPRERLVEARDIHLSFGATPALRGASVAVARGELLAIMGPSGSGKSTLLHCLAGILVPDSGEILFAGERVHTLGEEERSTLRREHFGFVFQFGQLVPEPTAEENVALPLLLGGRPPSPGIGRGPRVVRRVRPRRARGAPIRGAVGRASSAGRSGPRAGCPSRGPLRRRADGCARFAQRRARHEPVSRLPGPGQFYASPALSRLLRSTPANELGDRFPGHQIGTIGPSALPSPSSLIVVVGYSAQHLSKVPGATRITSINTNAGKGGPAGGFHTTQLQTILAVGALALLLPVLVFIGTAARLAAARREQRFAAMRLVGATSRQLAVISTVEASIAALCGVAIGFGLFYGIRPALTDVAFTGQRFAAGDLSLGLIDVVVVAIGVPIAAAVSARFAMRRAEISPLGVARRVTPPAPRAYRLAPLVAGIAELVYFVVVGHPKSTGGQIWAYLSGGFLVIAGLVVAGPWLTMVGARSVARRAQRPAALLAGRRLADNPSGAFRTISGLIIALFVASASVGVLTTILAYGGTAKGGTVASETLLEELGHVASIGVNGHRPPATATTTTKTAVPPALPGELTSIPGVRGATVVYSGPGAGQDSSAGLVLCSQLAHTPAIGTCAAGADVGRLSGLNPFAYGQHSTLSGHVWPAVVITPQQLRDLSPRAIVVQTNGSTAALERARTDLEVAFPDQQQTPATFGEIDALSRRTITEVQQIANVVIVASLVIAGCSLAVSVTAGISDRKRPFSLLRLAGAPLRVLRRMVVLEAADPLLVISVFSAGLGFLAAGLFLSSQLGYSLRPPGVDYYLLVLGGTVASLAVIASTLPLIERIAGPEVARNE